jgi:threonylcarbamoyladenosine tRNA methylthiotransferase MtaB
MLEVLSFGCRLNTLEAETMRLQGEKAGLTETIIINSCAVTSEATRQTRQAIRRLKRENPHKTIIVTGCAAQTEPEVFAEMAEVSQVIGNDVKLEASTWVKAASFGLETDEKIRVNDIFAVKEQALHLIDGLQGRARAFVQVQNGCDHRCTFCIIPFGRGNSRSVPMGEVVTQINHLVSLGQKEVVLTGVDLTSYGADLTGKPSLGKLVEAILKHTDLARLRISSIDSIEADETLIDALATQPRLMPHLHLSLQAGSNLILKRMKRRHLREDAIAFTQSLKKLRPEMVFGADIITGFPTETERDFQDSLALVDDCSLTYLHVFPYSIRKGTPAARMPQVPKEIGKERAARLRAKGEIAHAAHLQSLIEQPQTILIENETQGRTPCFALVQHQGLGKAGEIVTATPKSHNGKALFF